MFHFLLGPSTMGVINVFWRGIRGAYHFWILICDSSTKSANSSLFLFPIWYLVLCWATTQLTEIYLTRIDLHSATCYKLFITELMLHYSYTCKQSNTLFIIDIV